jgi:transposase InsO family protein
MNSIMERWIGSCRREPLDRTLVWNQRHLMVVLREYEDFYNTHRPHRTLKQAAPLRPLPDVSPTWAISGSIGVTAPECARATTEQPRGQNGHIKNDLER